MRLDKIKWDVIDSLTEQYGDTAKTFFYGRPEICDPLHTIVATDDVIVQPKWNIPKKMVVSTALTGSFFRKNDNPNQPITVDEIYKAGKEVCDAGGQIVHIHVRNDEGYNVIDIDRFKATIGRLKEEYPDRMFECCIVPRWEGEWDKLEKMLDMGYTETVTVNTVASYIGDMLNTKGPQVMIKKAKIIQEHNCKPRMAVYTDGDIDNARRYLLETGIIEFSKENPTHWGIVGPLPGCTPMNNETQMVEGLLHIVSRIRDIDPYAVIQVCASGRASSYLAVLSAIMGLNVRIGMEDTVWRYPHEDAKIENNAKLFSEFKNFVHFIGREIATANDYRKMIGLPLK